MQQPSSAAGAAAAVVHVRQDSEKDLMALFETLTSSSANRGVVPMRERNLPPSFFSPSASSTSRSVPHAAGHHSRDGSTDSSYSSQSSSMQSPAHGHMHFRSQSAPAPLPVGQPYDPDPLPAGWQVAFTSSGQRYFMNHATKTTTWHDPRRPMQKQQLGAAGPTAGATGARQPPVSKAPFFTPTSSLGSAYGPQEMAGLSQAPQEPSYRQRSTSWIDPSATGRQYPRLPSKQRLQPQQQMIDFHRMKIEREQFNKRQEELRQREIFLRMSGMNEEAAAVAAQAAQSQLAASQRDPFLPVTGSVSPDMTQFGSASASSSSGNATVPGTSTLSHVREGSTDSGFGFNPDAAMVTGMEGMGGSGLGELHNSGGSNSFSGYPIANSASPVPGIHSSRPGSAASGSITQPLGGPGYSGGRLGEFSMDTVDSAIGSGTDTTFDSTLGRLGGIAMDTDDLSRTLQDALETSDILAGIHGMEQDNSMFASQQGAATWI